MTITTNSNNNKNIPVGDNSTNTKDWIHKDLDCGHYQKISIDAKEVNCEGCGELVRLGNEREFDFKTNNREGQFTLTGEIVGDAGDNDYQG